MSDVVIVAPSFGCHRKIFLKTLSKPAAWGSGWTGAFLCFSAATGYWLAGERGRAMVWIALGAVEVAAIVL
jgi:hypothetical protein